MMTTPLNERSINVKITRGELCRLLILLTSVQFDAEAPTYIKKLHDKLVEQLRAFDTKQPDAPFLP